MKLQTGYNKLKRIYVNVNCEKIFKQYRPQVSMVYRLINNAGCCVLPTSQVVYQSLDNNQVNARALIGQSAVVYCASKRMEKSRVL